MRLITSHSDSTWIWTLVTTKAWWYSKPPTTTTEE